jgi:hypothetical protein
MPETLIFALILLFVLQVFQRIWSSRVTTERSAWELLSFIDQIHQWGVTDFRDFVLRHLRPWNNFAKKCYLNDIAFTQSLPNTGKVMEDGKPKLVVPTSCLALPEWTKHFTRKARERFKDKIANHLYETWVTYREVRTKEFPSLKACGMDKCSTLRGTSYPLASVDELIIHLREFHGLDDERMAKCVQIWEETDPHPLSARRIEMNNDAGNSTLEQARKRGSTGETNEKRASKRRRT